MTAETCSSCGGPAAATPGCRACAEVREHRGALLGGARAYETYTAELFAASKVTHAAYIAAKTFTPARENLYLWGPCGTGKSHLAAAAARPFLPHVATYTPGAYLAAVGVKGGPEEAETVRRVARTRVLVLDDLGRGAETPTRLAKLFDLLDLRYRERAGGLIVTSNYSLGQLADKLGDDALPSRLAQLCRVYDFTGEPDHRLEKRP